MLHTIEQIELNNFVSYIYDENKKRYSRCLYFLPVLRRLLLTRKHKQPSFCILNLSPNLISNFYIYKTDFSFTKKALFSTVTYEYLDLDFRCYTTLYF